MSPPPSKVTGVSVSCNHQLASRTVTTGSNVESIAAFVGPIRFSPDRKATTGSRVVITTIAVMAAHPLPVAGR